MYAVCSPMGTGPDWVSGMRVRYFLRVLYRHVWVGRTKHQGSIAAMSVSHYS
jgi:hypothetical protein